MEDNFQEKVDVVDSYQSKSNAINDYRTKYDGRRDVITWGPKKQPIEIIVKQTGNERKTFLNLGGADEIPVLNGNDEDQINALIDEFVSSATQINEMYKDIHMSRLELNNLNEPSKPPKSYFVVTGEIRQQL